MVDVAALAAGVTVQSATGRVTIATTAALAGATVTVTATNSGGSAATSFKATVTAQPANVLPFLLTVPLLSGSAKIGSTLTAGTGTWGGYPAPTAPRQWLRDGVAISGATGASYTLLPADDGMAVARLGGQQVLVAAVRGHLDHAPYAAYQRRGGAGDRAGEDELAFDLGVAGEGGIDGLGQSEVDQYPKSSAA